MRYLILLLLLATAASAYTISDYPDFFATDNTFKAIYVVGAEAPALDVVSATTISSALARYNLTTKVGTSYVDSEISNVSKKHAIVIGSPCENSAAAELEGNPRPCHANLGGGVGYIKLFEKNGKVQILITGLDADDRHAAAKFLAQRTLSSIDTKVHTVQSNSGSVPPFFAQKNTPKPKEPETTSEPEDDSEPVVAYTKELPETKKAPEQPKKIAEYEPIEEIPVEEKKGFFASIWSWFVGLFT